MLKIFEKYIKNVKNPVGFLGRKQLKAMNNRHNALSLWGLQQIKLDNAASVLDIGCGGGKNIENLLSYAKNAKVFGVDYSLSSVNMSQKHNKKAVLEKKVEIKQGSAEDLPFEDNYFDVITAFETVYFWNIEKAFCEVFRILIGGGKFLIVNEAVTEEGLEELIDKIGFNVYNGEQLKSALENAGFEDVKIILHENKKWISVVAKK
ncbi:class I SAM-dependent methyltransferase [bacterium]|nr:class I SAM-dependent methyltransferase [bacterium]